MSSDESSVTYPERRDISRLRKICNSLALLYPASRNNKSVLARKYVLRRWWTLLRLSKHERSLYLITCTRCAPKFWLRGQGFFNLDLYVTELNPNCVLCALLQQASRSFTDDAARRFDRITMSYWNWNSRNILLPMELRLSSNGHTKELCVQLCSAEPHNLQNPFPVLKGDICLDPTSVRMLSKIQGWIGSCVATHHDCTMPATATWFIPKRLIKLDGDARLSSPDIPVRYAALSYCWGSFEQPKTTKVNVEMRYSSLDISDLPRTLKDAVVVTRKLELDYLWIDSICIVQNDEEEWATESARMGDLYSNAHVVLAATGASDANEGFLSLRRQAHRITSLRGSKHSFTVQARVVDNHTPSQQIALDHLPLFKRGWAMQERFLATRTVHFLPDEVLYECRTCATCECGIANNSTQHRVTWPPEKELCNPDSTHELEFSDKWNRIVSGFSERHLTYANDVLPALSGIARRTLPLEPGDYIAGMWEKGIAFQLSWFVEDVSNGERRKNDVPGPTFSWMKSPSPVFYPYFNNSARPICTFLSGGSTPATSDIFGRITQAFVRLNGRAMQGSDLVKKVMDGRVLSHNGHKDYFGLMTIQLDTGRTYLPPFFAMSEKIPYNGLETVLDWSITICFGLYLSRHDRVVMLLLQRCPQQNSFVRVGLVVACLKIWFDEHATECDVTIV